VLLDLNQVGETISPEPDLTAYRDRTRGWMK
jgi:hypothetical protein